MKLTRTNNKIKEDSIILEEIKATCDHKYASKKLIHAQQ